MQLNDYTYGGDPPSLYETLQATHDAGLVGEEDTVLTLVLSIIRGHLVVMSGLSRAGKDEAVDAAESVFPADDMVYRWPSDDSATASYYEASTINQYPVHRFPDLARLPEHQEVILKSFGEGRDAERKRTDIVEEKKTGDAIREQVIKCPDTVIAFIATDNENVDLDDYPELRNRALVVTVDASESQTKAVNRRKAQQRAGQDRQRVEPLRREQIKNYHASIPADDWIHTPGNDILNPAAINIHEQEPIPEKFPEARQDFDRLLEFMETTALYHYTERLVAERNGGHVMLVAPIDVWYAMTILGNKMVMSALNLTREDREILRLLDGTGSKMVKSDIQQSLRAEGYNISDRDVGRSLRSMREKGYVVEHQASPNEYTLSPFASVTKHDAGLDYGEIAESAADTVGDIIQESATDIYRERFCQGDGLIATHPFTGEAVNITKDDSLKAALNEGTGEVEAIVSGEKVAEPAQGTL